MIKLYKSIHNYICQYMADYYFYNKRSMTNPYSKKSILALDKYFMWIDRKFRE